MLVAPPAFPGLSRARHEQAVSKQMMSAPTGIILKHFVYITLLLVFIYLWTVLSPPPTASQSQAELFFLSFFVYFFFLLFFIFFSFKMTICRFVLHKNKAIHLLWLAVLSRQLRKSGSVKVYSSCRSP